MKKICILIILIAVYTSAGARNFCGRVFVGSQGQIVPYRILFPEKFDPSCSYPLFLFLHGAGERGTDNESQLIHGGEVFEKDKNLRNVIVIIPQCPKEDYWVNIVRPVTREEQASREFPENAPISSSLSAVKELLDAYISLGFVDTDRIYGSGLSMGGFGILDLAVRYPDFFRGVESICGGINVNRMKNYSGKTSFRFFHGAKDDIVLPRFSREACESLVENGIEATIIEYPEANHNSWDSAFAEPDYISWFFALK